MGFCELLLWDWPFLTLHNAHEKGLTHRSAGMMSVIAMLRRVTVGLEFLEPLQE